MADSKICYTTITHCSLLGKGKFFSSHFGFLVKSQNLPSKFWFSSISGEGSHSVSDFVFFGFGQASNTSYLSGTQAAPLLDLRELSLKEREEGDAADDQTARARSHGP